MASSLKCILIVAVIASIACSAYAIRCYQCDTITNPKCAKDFDSDDHLKFDCATVAPPRWLQIFNVRNATGCMKKTLESGIGQPQIIRTCYFGDISNTQSGCASDPALPFVKQLSCDVCSSNLCNGSSSMTPIVGAILAFLALARFLS